MRFPGLLNLGLAIATPMAVSHAATFQTLYSFSGGVDGLAPYGKLVQDSAGILYGVTVSGGTAQRGNIFRFDPATSMLTNLYSFSGGVDGSNPQSGLALDAQGNLYGVTPHGGSTYTSPCSSGCGTIFKFNLSAGKLITLYSFTGKADGAQPIAALLLDGGALYGTASEAGSNPVCGVYGCGTVFRFKLSNKTFTTLHNFDGKDGTAPEARLVRGSSGLLYGSIGSGGAHGSGSVYQINHAGGALVSVHDFDYHVDGAYSDGDLTVRNGFVYGTEPAGGPTASNDGTVYKLALSGGALTTLYSFQGGNDGQSPAYGVVLGPKGLLYGATTQGGADGAGTLFDVNPANSAYLQIHSFAISDGTSPSGPLLAGSTGALYGVTSGGGSGHGTIFKIVP